MDSQNMKPALISVGDLLTQSWAIYTKRVWTFAGIMIAPILAIVGMIILALGVGSIFPAEMSFNALGILVSIAIFVSLIIYPLGSLALLVAINGYQEKIGVKESYRLSWPKFWSYCWVLFLLSCVIGLGFFLFIIPGILFFIWYGFAIFVVVFEDSKGMAALSKSKEYVKGYWWGVFGRTLLILFLGNALYGLEAIISTSGISHGEEITGLLTLLIFFFVGPFTMTYLFLMYADLRRIKEQSVNNV